MARRRCSRGEHGLAVQTIARRVRTPLQTRRGRWPHAIGSPRCIFPQSIIPRLLPRLGHPLGRVGIVQRKPSYICNVNSQQNEALPYSIRTAVWRRPAVRRRELQVRRLDPRKYRTPTAMPSGTHGTGQARLRSAMQYQHRPKTGLRHIRAFHKDRCDRPPADPRPPRAGSIAQYSRYPDLPGPVIRAGADDQYA